uniref:Uncharacterized protein n=1 Tax=Arundo donax TaxID=35708 RepID=A0A0A9B3D0_ARUDO
MDSCIRKPHPFTISRRW